MKLLLAVDFNSNEYWDATTYALLVCTPEQLEKCRQTLVLSRQFLADAQATLGGYGCDNTRDSSDYVEINPGEDWLHPNAAALLKSLTVMA